MNVKIADRLKTAVIVIVSMIMVLAFYVSRDHITDVAHRIGLEGYQAETLFILIDVVALIGKVLQLKYFAASTQRVGRKLMWAAGALSLGCNVASGWLSGGYGPAAYGVFIVALFLILENVVTKIKPAAAVTRAKNAAAGIKAAPRKRASKAAPRKRVAKAAALVADAPAASPALHGVRV